jgi:hypothetical protein
MNQMLRKLPLIFTRRLALIFIIAFSAILRGWYWLYTGFAVDDAYIIGRVVRNLVEHGQFTINLGQRVSSSTSPLYTLMVALLTFMGIEPISAEKWLGLFASVVTCVILFLFLERYFSTWVGLAGSLIYACLPPVIAYSVIGMETPLYTLACALALERMIHQHSKTAIFFGTLAAIVRIDGILVLAVVLLGSVWQIYRKRPWMATLAQLVRDSWPIYTLLPFQFVLHWLYFGTFLPHSVAAKAVAYAIYPAKNIVRYLDRMLFSQSGSLVIYFLAMVGIAWAIHRCRRALFLVVWYVVYYLFFMLRAPLFDWYLQPPVFVLCLLAACGLFYAIERVLEFVRQPRWIAPAQLVAGLGLAIILLIALLPYARSRQTAQRYNDQVLIGVGQWLAQNTPQDAVIFTETLGYIGYYTPNPLVDWPGLADASVPGAIQSAGAAGNRVMAYDVVVSQFHPDYLAIRDGEYQSLAPALQQIYPVCVHFAGPQPADMGFVIASSQCQK